MFTLWWSSVLYQQFTIFPTQRKFFPILCFFTHLCRAQNSLPMSPRAEFDVLFFRHLGSRHLQNQLLEWWNLNRNQKKCIKPLQMPSMQSLHWHFSTVNSMQASNKQLMQEVRFIINRKFLQESEIQSFYALWPWYQGKSWLTPEWA